jgi:hypothetical protein
MEIGKISWSEERIALLTEFWVDGLSASAGRSHTGLGTHCGSLLPNSPIWVADRRSATVSTAFTATILRTLPLTSAHSFDALTAGSGKTLLTCVAELFGVE